MSNGVDSLAHSFSFGRLNETTVPNLFQIRVLNHFVLNFCEKNIFKKKKTRANDFSRRLVIS